MRKSNLDIEIVTSFLLLSSSIEKIINIMIEGIKRKNKNKKRMHTFK
jgi:CRISPR/Cas system endoribonuclease Cas6 (RAMP superfamily)